MINIFPHQIVWVLSELDVYITVCRHNDGFLRDHGMRHLPDAEVRKQAQARDELLSSLDKLLQICQRAVEQMNSPHIDQAIASLSRMTVEYFQWSDCCRQFIALRQAIKIELEQHYFYQYKKDKGLVFFHWKRDWKYVIISFPNAEIDIFSAVGCYALEHNTASVFHAMRVAELGLRSIARERSLQMPKDKLVEWSNWQEIIKALDGEIFRIGQLPPGPEKDRLLAFYSGARADLNGFKDEYRNVVMHVRINFDDVGAASALRKVKEFMSWLVAFGLMTV